MNESPPPLVAPWRIGVDVGGTFTDMVLRDSAGAVRIYKAPSVPADPSEGVLGVLRLAAQQLDLPLSALLRDCALFVHGSTVATNTILEKKGAKVGMLTTEGFRDSLEIRRGIRENQWDHRAPFPPVLAPRYLRLPVRGRIGADGKELSPLVARGCRRRRHGVHRRRRRIGRRLPVQQLSGRHARARGRRTARTELGRQVDFAVERGHADDGRVRARLDRRGQCLHRAQGDELPRRARRAAAPVGPAPLAPPAAKQWRRGIGRRGRQPSRDAGAVRPGRRCRRAERLRRAGRAGQPDLDGDRRHQLRRHGDGARASAGSGRACHRRLPSHHAVGRNPHRRRRRRRHRLGRRRGPACMSGRKAPARGRDRPPTGWAASSPPSPTRSSCSGACAPARWPAAPSPWTGRWRARRWRRSLPSRSASRSRTPRPASFACWSRTCCMPWSGSASSAGTIPRPSPWSPPAAPDRCTAPPWPARWAAAAPCCRARRAPSARWACCSPTCGRITCRSSSPISTRSIAPALDAGFAQLEKRARDALAREGFGDSAAIEREVDLRYDGQQWPVRVALSSTGFDAAAARRAFEAEHQRLFGHIQPGGRIDITALRVVGRGRLDWTPPAARSPQAAPPKPRETAQGLDRSGARLARRAGL